MAYDIKNEITKLTPFPMELKFEKIYQPFISCSKKRYCGYKFEKLTDSPVIEAKGIEIVRRDGCLLT